VYKFKLGVDLREDSPLFIYNLKKMSKKSSNMWTDVQLEIVK